MPYRVMMTDNATGESKVISHLALDKAHALCDTARAKAVEVISDNRSNRLDGSVRHLELRSCTTTYRVEIYRND